jgi:hypothetical protein
MCPVKNIFKILTIFFLSFFGVANITFAQNLIGQEKATTYLRWNFFTGRDQLQFSKKGNKVVIKILNSDLYSNLKDELATLAVDPSYIVKINYGSAADVGSSNGMTIEVELKNENVEMFSFYRERDKKYVVDFWIDGDTVSFNKSSVKKEVEVAKVETEKENPVEVTPLPVSLPEKTNNPPVAKVSKAKTKKNKSSKKSKSRFGSESKGRQSPFSFCC